MFIFILIKLWQFSKKTVFIAVVVNNNFKIYNTHNIHTLGSKVRTHEFYFLNIAMKKNSEKDKWHQRYK